ncbi:unnamed protein product, partial [Symbiodinium microadriaticum]
MESVWGGPILKSDRIGLVGIADFNEDGTAEIYYRDEIIDINGNTVVASAGGNWERTIVHGPVAVDILPDSYCADCSGLELITGRYVYAVNIAAGTKTVAADINTDLAASGYAGNEQYHVKYYPNWDDQWTAVSVADFDGDGDMDILMPGALGTSYSDPTTIFYWDVNEGVVDTYQDPTNNHPRGTGRINIADTDGDGDLNEEYPIVADVDNDGVKLNTDVRQLVNLEVGADTTLTATTIGPGGDFDLFFVINDPGTNTPPIDLENTGIAECETSNNIGSVSTSYTPFPLSLDYLKDNEKCFGGVDNGSAYAYFFGEVGGTEENIWYEDFQDLSAGTTVDNDETAWSFTGGASANTAEVGTYNGSTGFYTRNVGGANGSGQINLTTQEIPVDGYTGVQVSVDMISSSAMETSGQWQDFTRAYISVDGGARQLMTNGEGLGSYLYQNATFSVPDGSSTVRLEFDIHSTANAEHQLLDNLLVTGIAPTVQDTFDTDDGYTFYWFQGQEFEADFNTIDFEGDTHPSMATGWYTVIGYYPPSNCYSDTLEIEIQEIEPEYNVSIVETAAASDCLIPNGSLKAIVTVGTDTLTSGYSFEWVDAAEGETVIGVTAELGGLEGGKSYKVTVTDQ